jgi:hypothetical protein
MNLEQNFLHNNNVRNETNIVHTGNNISDRSSYIISSNYPNSSNIKTL